MPKSLDALMLLRRSESELRRVQNDLQLLEERCRSLEAQLRHSQKMQALGTMTSGIAHDFNNILTAIGGHAELALSELPDGPVQDSLTEIKSAFLRARDMVRRILVFSRLQESERKPVTLAPIVEDALRLLRVTIPKTIVMGVRAERDLPVISADATEIHQVIMNLGTNAVHAMGDRAGRITIRIDRVRITEANPPVRRLAPGPYQRLMIRDKGSGISPDIIDRIFDPFFTTKGDGGTGLGLAVVDGIMREHRGGITVDSKPGKGATFCLFFPEVRTAGEVPKKERVTMPRGSGQHIMYVDDEPALRRLMIRMLESIGYKCTAFADPDSALQTFRTNPDAFDAVITDMSMPGISGLTLARALAHVRPGIPIAIISGEASEDVKPDGQIVRTRISKPATMRELSVAVEALVNPSR